MTYQVPNFDEQAFTEIAREHYGLEGEISSFVSYEDQNALIKTPKGKFVIKIANKRWDLDNVLACKAYLPDVIDEDARDRITRLYEEYEKSIRPKLQNLRKAILHGDANEHNFLVLPDQPNKIAELIDFGEMPYGTQINDLAIALAYSLLGENDIQMAANNIIDGYTREFPLEEAEIDILYHLMAMRLVTTITMTSHSEKQHPNNKYILISQKPARALLKKLEDENIINIH
ncbi:phosphotransferase [Desulfobacula sp.]